MSLGGGGLGGMQVGAPTGADKGVGTINAIAVYANNTLLTSDARFKRGVLPLGADIDALSLVEAIKPVSFQHVRPPPPEPIMTADGPLDVLTPDDAWFERRWWGFLAQDIEETTAGLGWGGVVTSEDGEHKAVSQGCLVACLWQAVRELKAELDFVRKGN